MRLPSCGTFAGEAHSRHSALYSYTNMFPRAIRRAASHNRYSTKRRPNIKLAAAFKKRQRVEDGGGGNSTGQVGVQSPGPHATMCLSTGRSLHGRQHGRQHGFPISDCLMYCRDQPAAPCGGSSPCCPSAVPPLRRSIPLSSGMNQAAPRPLVVDDPGGWRATFGILVGCAWSRGGWCRCVWSRGEWSRGGCASPSLQSPG